MLEHRDVSTVQDLNLTIGYKLNRHPDNKFSYLYEDDLFTSPNPLPSTGDWMIWDELNKRSTATPCMKLCTAWSVVKNSSMLNPSAGEM